MKKKPDTKEKPHNPPKGPSPQKGKPVASKAPQKEEPHQAMLAKYEHHRAQSRKHSAHADLIEAKLRTQGKEIQHDYSPKGVEKRVVRDARY